MIEQKLTAVDAAVDKRVRRLNERNEKRKSTPIRAAFATKPLATRPVSPFLCFCFCAVFVRFYLSVIISESIHYWAFLLKNFSRSRSASKSIEHIVVTCAQRILQQSLNSARSLISTSVSIVLPPSGTILL